jgi:hypothetical protein
VKLNEAWLAALRWANRRSVHFRRLRPAGIALYIALMRGFVWLPPPRVLLNGVGKSGTHLLADCFSLLPRMVFSGRHWALSDFVAPTGEPDQAQYFDRQPEIPLDGAKLRRYLAACRRGMFTTAHARFHPVLAQVVRDLDFRHILLLRDPRDVVVSLTHYILRDSRHQHHLYYTQSLNNESQRLRATILGFEGVPNAPPRAAIAEIVRGYLTWARDPAVLPCRFEDLVGPRGGGDRERQLATIQQLANHVNRPLDAEQVERVASKMYSRRSPTYRKGIVGDWRNHFTPDIEALFQEAAGATLTEAGYA